MPSLLRQRWQAYEPVLELALAAIHAEIDGGAESRAAGLAAVERLRGTWQRGQIDRQALLELYRLTDNDLPGSLVVRAALEAIEGWAAELEHA